MINFFKFLVPGLAALLIGLVSLPAQAIAVAPPPLTFYFSGNCEDCASLEPVKSPHHGKAGVAELHSKQSNKLN